MIVKVKMNDISREKSLRCVFLLRKRKKKVKNISAILFGECHGFSEKMGEREKKE